MNISPFAKDFNAQLGFYSRNDLKQIMDQSNIVVHCANVEVEGMACMEAFATGCVPIIAQSPLFYQFICFKS